MLTRNTIELGADGASVATIDPTVTRARLASLAESIEKGGMAADPMGVLLVAHTARDLGVSPVLVSVLADEHEPAVARERAFGRVSVQIDARLDAVRGTTMLPSTC